jgi:hypothetical protein
VADQRTGAETAFPQPCSTGPNGDFLYGTPGLAKRELFAAMAMQGLCAGLDYSSGRMIDFDGLASDAAACADALLVALEKPAEDERS